MTTSSRTRIMAQASMALMLASATAAALDRAPLPAMMPFANPSGFAATYSTAGAIDFNNPFFRTLGANGRSCESCHQASEGWTVTPDGIRRRFVATDGLDPIFRPNDGANAPNLDVSTVEARVKAYSMLLDRGVMRVGMPIPPNAEFELVAVDDPYGYASAHELSLFRRPLPATNLRFMTAIMWDGRETLVDPSSTTCILGSSTCFGPLHANLDHQADDAAVGHAQAAAPLDAATRSAIVTFESSLFTAQVFDAEAGMLDARGGHGGPKGLAEQDFWFGINDVVSGDYRTGALFDGTVFRLYGAWTARHAPKDGDDAMPASVVSARRSVARGEVLFNTKPIRIAGVSGLNDDLSVPVLDGTCTTCHDTPGVGNHSIPAPVDIGIADPARRTPDMPLYTLRHKVAGILTSTTDPGRALVTGLWKDIGRFKGPVLRAVAARAPYFHDGSAADLAAVIDFYDKRFSIGFTDDEKRDLAAFLRTL
jgi:cytochrome c peroxidase